MRRAPLLLTLALLARPLVATDGDLRTSFETGGVFSYGTTAHLRALHGAVAAPDGAVVVFGGAIEISGDTTTFSGLHWRRVTLAGVGAECNSAIPLANFGWIMAAGFQGNDLVVAGPASMTADSKKDFVVARYNYPACDLDENFDGDGIRTFDFGSSLVAEATGIVPITFIHSIPDPPFVSLERDLFVSGIVGDNDVGVARLDLGGGFDTDFDFDGKAIYDLGAVEIAVGMARGPSGELLVLARSEAFEALNLDFFLLGIDPTDGAAFSAFGDNGLARVDFDLDAPSSDYAGVIAVSDEDRIYASGSGTNDPNFNALVAELDADGDPNPGFDGEGRRNFSAFTGGAVSGTYGSGLAVQSDDQLVVTGNAAQSGGFGPGIYAARLRQNGAFDSGFGSAGLVKHPLDLIAGAGESLNVGGVALLEGRILVAGFAQAVGINREFVAMLENALVFADDFESGSSTNW